MLTTRRHEEDTFYKGRKICKKGDKWTWSTDSKYCISASGLKYSLHGASRGLMRLKRNKTHEVPSQGYRSRKVVGYTLLVLQLHASCTEAAVMQLLKLDSCGVVSMGCLLHIIASGPKECPWEGTHQISIQPDPVTSSSCLDGCPHLRGSAWTSKDVEWTQRLGVTFRCQCVHTRCELVFL